MPLGDTPEGSGNREGEGSPPAGQREEALAEAECEVISSICRSCAGRLASYREPVLVVSREWVRLYEELAELMKDRPDIRVVLDRREAPREETEGKAWNGPDRRKPDQPLTLA
jgi:hypothetical protein